MGFDWAKLDGFVLTKPLATGALKKEVEKLIKQLDLLQEDFSKLINDYTLVASKLDKMEEKADFVVDELEKTLAIFDPPPPGKPEEDVEQMQRDVYDPIEKAELGLFGGSVFLGVISYVKMRPYKKSMKAAMKAGTKQGGKLGAKAAKYKFLARNAKAARAARLGKFASKLGAVGLVVGVVAYGLSIKEADKMNTYYKEKNAEIQGQISDVKETVEELREAIIDSNEMIAEMLEDAGVDTIEEYTNQLNETLAMLGGESANLTTARLMLIDGMPAKLVLKYVKGIKETVVNDLALRIAAEQQILDGDENAEISNDTGLSLIKIAAIREILSIRNAIMRGQDLAAFQEKNDYSNNLLEGERERLENNLRAVWDEIEALEDPAAMSQVLLVPQAEIKYLSQELSAKKALFDGSAAPDVAKEFNIDKQQVDEWASGLEERVRDARTIVDNGVLLSPIDVAVERRLPLSLVSNSTGDKTVATS